MSDMTAQRRDTHAHTNAELTAMEREFTAPNYAPLPAVISRGEGVWLTDVEGRRYLDLLAGYSALSFGHGHPRIKKAFLEQADRLTVVSRAFESDQLGPFARELAAFCGMEQILPMNTGAEAVESAIKTARKWAYCKKGVPIDHAEIIVCEGNFHGRTTTIVGFSSVDQYRIPFGPYGDGFRLVPFGDAEALREAITPHTAAFLFEPIQGEGGINIPPAGYIAQCKEICRDANVLFIADEIQTGLGRTGKTFACDHDDTMPDMYILGKALGGGMYPVSAIVSSKEILGVFQPGDHGSTFGGNPLAAAVGREALRVLVDEDLVARSAELGQYLRQRLNDINSPKVREIRGKGLLCGIELREEAGTAGQYVRRLLDEGVLCKETVKQVIRITPPLVISREDLDTGIEQIAKVLTG